MIALWMSGLHYAEEDRSNVAVTHLALARRQKAGNGILGTHERKKREPVMALFSVVAVFAPFIFVRIK